MPATPSAREIKDAVESQGIDAIPYPDLRAKGKRENEKQKKACKNFKCDALTEANEIEAASLRAKSCRERRINVRIIFKQAIGRIKIALKKMDYGDPLKPDLTTILDVLTDSQDNHEKAIDEVNKAYAKCEKKLKQLEK